MHTRFRYLAERRTGGEPGLASLRPPAVDGEHLPIGVRKRGLASLPERGLRERGLGERGLRERGPTGEGEAAASSHPHPIYGEDEDEDEDEDDRRSGLGARPSSTPLPHDP